MKSSPLYFFASIWLAAASFVDAGWVPSNEAVEFHAPQKGDIWSADCWAPDSCQFQLYVPPFASQAAVAKDLWKVGLFKKRALWFDKLVYARALDVAESGSVQALFPKDAAIPALKNGKYYLAVFRNRRMLGRRYVAKSQVFSVYNLQNHFQTKDVMVGDATVTDDVSEDDQDKKVEDKGNVDERMDVELDGDMANEFGTSVETGSESETSGGQNADEAEEDMEEIVPGALEVQQPNPFHLAPEVRHTAEDIWYRNALQWNLKGAKLNAFGPAPQRLPHHQSVPDESMMEVRLKNRDALKTVVSEIKQAKTRCKNGKLQEYLLNRVTVYQDAKQMEVAEILRKLVAYSFQLRAEQHGYRQILNKVLERAETMYENALAA